MGQQPSNEISEKQVKVRFWVTFVLRCFVAVCIGFPMGRNRSKKLSWRSRNVFHTFFFRQISNAWRFFRGETTSVFKVLTSPWFSSSDWCLVRKPGARTLDFVQTVRRGAFETEFSSGKCGWSISSEPGTFQKLRECVFFVWGIWRGNMLDLLGCFFFGKIFWNGIVKENTLDFRSHLFCFFSVGWCWAKMVSWKERGISSG